MLVLAACGSAEQSYFPLESRYKWHYDVTQITRDGLEKQKYYLTNLGKSTVMEQSVYLRRSMEGTTLYYSVSDSGIEYLGQKPALGVEPEFIEDKQTVFPYPITDETAWQQMTTTRLLKKTGPPQKTEFRIIAKVPMDARIESMNEAVSVPAGKFENCMKISMSGSTYKDAGNYVGLTLVNVEQTNWYARGVGLVKMERVETTQSDALDQGSLLIELAEYSPR